MNPVERLKKINSLTKYPSILTYHKLGKGKLLTEDRNSVFDDELAIYTEKIHGANGRIIVDPFAGEYYIGSREELLVSSCEDLSPLAYRDRLSIKIVSCLRDPAEWLLETYKTTFDQSILTFYFEVFGSGVGKEHLQYSSKNILDYRMFDVSKCSLDKLEWTIEQIAGWRSRGGQDFMCEEWLLNAPEMLDIPLTPRLSGYFPDRIPATIAETYRFLKNFSKTEVLLDDQGLGKPEGIVVRNSDRSKIAKIRYEDYEFWQRKTAIRDHAVQTSKG